MTNFIIKPERDVDYYISWSNIAEAPKAWGSRSMLMADKRCNSTTRDFDRADRLGSSSFTNSAGWNDSEIVYMGEGTVLRESLRSFVEALEVDGDNNKNSHQYITPYFDDFERIND